MWRFDHLLAGQREFAGFVEERLGSPALDLRGGFDHYCQRRPVGSSKHFSRLESKLRGLQREQGDVHFEFDARDRAVLDQVIVWKRAQCLRTGVPDFLAERRHTDLIRTIFETRTGAFAGILSVLRAGGRIAAAHFGMRTHDTLHYWFPAYEREFAKHSPGEILLVELIRAAAAGGFVHFDLGKGSDEYKQRFCTHEVLVAEGAVIVSRPVAMLRYAYRLACSLRRSSLSAPLRAPLHALRRMRRRVVQSHLES